MLQGLLIEGNGHVRVIGRIQRRGPFEQPDRVPGGQFPGQLLNQGQEIGLAQLTLGRPSRRNPTFPIRFVHWITVYNKHKRLSLP